MATYLETANVLVAYPNVERNKFARSRVTSEENIVNAIKHLSPSSEGTFICDDSDIVNGETIRFYIGGYYFEAKIPFSQEYIWVGITLTEVEDRATYEGYKELRGEDDNNNLYNGLQFAPTESELSDCDYKMQLLVSNGTGYELNKSVFLSALWANKVNIYFIDSEKNDAPENNSELTSSIWIDSTNKYIPRVYDKSSNTWIKLGAVYKN